MLGIRTKDLPNLVKLANRWIAESGLKEADRLGRAQFLERKFSRGDFSYSLTGVERDHSIDPIEDFLTKRNANLLKEIEAELPGSEVIVVPWGAAHMRGIAEGIQKTGFHLVDTEEHLIFHFRSVWHRLFHVNKPKANGPTGPTTAISPQGSP